MKRYDLNSAVREIASALNCTIGTRRTNGGADDSANMHIAWQLLDGDKVAGMIDLICSDGLGPDGMDWHGEVRITAHKKYLTRKLLLPTEKIHGRKAKRITRQNFVLKTDWLIQNMNIV